MVEHFITYEHAHTDFSWTVFAAIKMTLRGGDPETLLAQKEAFFIMKFDTALHGLNELSEIARL